MTGAPDDVANLLRASCYDCHGHTTQYPWYSYIAPVSWWIKNHVNEGRQHLNFSTWNEYSIKKRIHKLEECAEMIENQHMPLPSYINLHEEAVLTEAERQKLVIWFKSEIETLKFNTGK